MESNLRSWSSYITTWEVAEELNIDHSRVVWRLKQIGKVKRLNKWEPHELTENQKNCHFEVSSSFILHNNLWTIARLDCDMWQKEDFYMMTSSVLGLRRSSKHFPKPNLQQRSWSLFGGLIPVWSTTAFWIPEKPLHLRSMLSKSMICTKNCKAYSHHCQQQYGPSSSHNQCFKSWVNWVTYKVLPYLPCSHDLSPTYFFFKYLNNFLQEKSFHTQQEAENAFEEFVEIWSTIFTLQE